MKYSTIEINGKHYVSGRAGKDYYKATISATKEEALNRARLMSLEFLISEAAKIAEKIDFENMDSGFADKATFIAAMGYDMAVENFGEKAAPHSTNFSPSDPQAYLA